MWRRHAAGGRPHADAYEATRAEMERRIFTDAIPCSRADGTPSPFAAGKMRDRMRGNAFPFLPLSGEQMAAAFEMQLERRANHYEDENGVSLHWTRDFARLAMPAPSPAASASAASDGAAGPVRAGGASQPRG